MGWTLPCVGLGVGVVNGEELIMSFKNAIYNPHDKPVEELPVIMGFNNGGQIGFLSAVAIAEDGTELGGHCCSCEAYMEEDLGIIEGFRKDRHEGQYQKHYPDGYKMEFVERSQIKKHEKLQAAFKLNAQKHATK